MRDSQRGAAAVELAVVLPILFLLVFGAVQFIMLIHYKTVADHAAHEAVRQAAFGGRQAAAKQRAEKIVGILPRGATPGKGRPRVRVSERGERTHVRIRCQVELLPFFKQVAVAGGGGGAVSIVSVAVARNEPYAGY